MTQQTPEVLLNQLRFNLKLESEIAIVREHSERLIGYFNNQGFEFLVKDLNSEYRLFFGNGQEFSESDFDNAKAYPNQDFVLNYQRKHGLPPLSLCILIAKEKWTDFACKLNLDPMHYGHTIEKRFFKDSILELKTGISFHLNRNLESDVEFENLHSDGSLYSETNSICSKISPQKLLIPPLAILTFEYLILNDLCAWRVESPDSESMIDYLTKRMDYYIRLTPDFLKVPEEMRAKTISAYRTILSDSIERIQSAVIAVYDLESKIGSRLLTPVLFSLGSTQEELSRNHLLSPLIGIKNLNDYINSGEITKAQIQQILTEKGYLQQDELLHGFS